MLEKAADRIRSWRARSRVAAVLDGAAVALGAVIALVAGVDDVVSWPRDRVLLADDQLTPLMGFLILPLWLWLMVGMAPIAVGWQNAARGDRPPIRVVWRRLYFPTVQAALALGALALLCLTVVVGGFVAGAAKGEARRLAGPHYQVATAALGADYAWTEVTPREYDRWRADFVRQDGLFVFFGVFGIVLGTALRRSRTEEDLFRRDDA